ncbi:DUF7509 family protein [Candidatus Halobonum tyrrellensis]|nr:hypothetical protein [Candidatus Halobonum tyrrellensis]
MRTYDGTPMREVLLDRLPPTAHTEFLVYVMGPYTTFRPDYYLRDDLTIDDADLDMGAFGDAETELQDELRDIVEWLRTDVGVNAFLAVDPDIPTEGFPDETDAERMNVISQSKAYAEASNAVVFILPKAGVRDGVDIEIGAVLSGFDLGLGEGTPQKSPQRFHVFREHGVSSATLDAVPHEYEVALSEYGTRSELHEQLERFLAGVLRSERRGDLSSVDGSTD